MALIRWLLVKRVNLHALPVLFPPQPHPAAIASRAAVRSTSSLVRDKTGRQ